MDKNQYHRDAMNDDPHGIEAIKKPGRWWSHDELAEHDRQEREKVLLDAASRVRLGVSAQVDQVHEMLTRLAKQEPNVVRPREQEREALIASFDTRGNGVLHPRDIERLAEFDRETTSSRAGGE